MLNRGTQTGAVLYRATQQGMHLLCVPAVALFIPTRRRKSERCSESFGAPLPGSCCLAMFNTELIDSTFSEAVDDQNVRSVLTLPWVITITDHNTPLLTTSACLEQPAAKPDLIPDLT